jgi:hypothetical protein
MLERKVFIYGYKGELIDIKNSITLFAEAYDYTKSSFQTNDFIFMENKGVASLNRIGRKKAREIIRRELSPFVGKSKSLHKGKSIYKKKVFLYDMDGDLMATFESIFHARLLTNLSSGSFYSKLKTGSSKYTSDGILIKVK